MDTPPNPTVEKPHDSFSEAPRTEKLRHRLEEAISKTIHTGSNAVYRSPTSSGKTYFTSTTPWRNRPEVTGGQPVVHLSPTKETRNSAYRKSKEAGVESMRLLGREDACPVAGGDYDSETGREEVVETPDGSEPSEWFQRMCDDRDLPFSVAHGELEREQDDDTLPCARCRGMTQWRDVPRDEKDKPSHDVIFATHNFARAPSLIRNCNIIIDEQPDFTDELSTGEIRQAIGSYLRHIDFRVGTCEELMTEYGDSPRDSSALAALGEPDTEWFREGSDANLLAPAIARAIVIAEEQAHDRWKGEIEYDYPELNPSTDTPEYRVRVRLVFEDNYDIKLFQVVPDFTEARSVVGLDAYPTEPKWEASTLSNIQFERLLDREEAQQWRRKERNLEIVQIGDNKNSWTTSGFSDEKVDALCAELRHRFGAKFETGITSSRFEPELQRGMREADISAPKTMHYGDVRSTDSFDDQEVGLAAGCISPSSDTIKDWLALLEKDATPRREKDGHPDRGQEWVGPDAATAHKLLCDVREQGVLQAVGRYARSPSDPKDGATVYVLTNVLPERFIDRHVEDVNLVSESEREILTTLADAPEALSASELHDRVDSSERYVHEVLGEHAETKWLTEYEDAGNYNATLYSANRCPEAIVEI